MPEGHKTHWLAQQHERSFAGESLWITSPQGRFLADAKRVNRKRLNHVIAVGKQLFYEFENDLVVQVHLGRYGKFTELPSPPPKPKGLVRMRMRGESTTWDLNGPTICRVIDCVARDRIIAGLGPDPLAGAKKSDVWKRVRSSNRPIGTILLDQAMIAGVGNIFRAEVLFEAGVDPNTRCSDLTSAQFGAIWKSLVRMMKTGLKFGRIIAVTAKEAGQPLAKIHGPDRFRVYGKRVCPRCENQIEATKIASRTMYWCKACQSATVR